MLLWNEKDIKVDEKEVTSDARNLVADGIPPDFLRRKWWAVQFSTPKKFELSEDTPGLDYNLRAKLPDFNFPLTQKSSTSVVVGKWYIPFMFVKEGRLEDQIQGSMYNRMVLEQRWEQIFSSENSEDDSVANAIDAAVEREVIKVDGKMVASDSRNVADGLVWFTVDQNNEGGEASVGLRLAVVERMNWEEERFGWSGGGEREVEKFEGVGDCKKYGCYVLVESFVLRRMDGSLVLSYEYKHIDKIRSKWNQTFTCNSL